MKEKEFINYLINFKNQYNTYIRNNEVVGNCIPMSEEQFYKKEFKKTLDTEFNYDLEKEFKVLKERLCKKFTNHNISVRYTNMNWMKPEFFLYVNNKETDKFVIINQESLSLLKKEINKLIKDGVV